MKRFPVFVFVFVIVNVIVSCTKQVEHIAPAVEESDSVAVMESYGINMLVSDSGVIKYRIVTERCITNENINPKRSIFEKGVFLTQFDEKYHVKAYVFADTAYRYEDLRLLELRGRVQILNTDGLIYRGEQLYWDQAKREFYSYTYSYLQTPERTIEGQFFRSDENMNKYYVSDSKGIFERADLVKDEKPAPEATEKKDTAAVEVPKRQPQTPYKKR